MKGTLKWLGIVVGAIVGLFVILAIAAPLLVDPNDYKETVVEAVKDRTGRDLRIPGNIELTVFPWIGVELGEAELSNAEGFTEPVFARTEKVNVRVKLLPLLSRRLEMDTVTIHGLTLNLERNARGRGNWEDLAAAGEAKSAPAKPSDGGAGTGGAPDAGAIGALAIGGLDVRDATLTWRDTTKNQRYELHNLSLQTGAIEEGEPVDLDMSVDVSVGEPRIDGHVSMAGKVLADPRAGTTRIEGLSIDGDFTGESLPGGKAEVSLAADVSHDAAKGTLALESLAVRALDLVLEGALQASGLDGAPRFTGQLASNEFNLRELIEALTGKAPDTADAKAMSRVSLKTGIGGGANALALEPLEVVLDQSTLRGKASVPDLSAQALRFDLALDAIDIDRYLPPSGAQGAGGAGQSAPAASTPGTAAGAAAGAPNEQLRKLDVDGRLTAGKIKVAKLNMSEVSAVVKAKGGVIKLSPLSARLYDGTYQGDIGIDARGEQPRITLNERLTGIQAEPLLADLQDGAARLSGVGNVALELAAIGADADAIKRSLDGKASFAFTDGALKGVNIAHMIRVASARLKGEPPPPAEAQQTDFSELSGSVRLDDGVASNQDLLAKTPLLRIEGRGSADLPKETVDYRLTTTLVATAKGQGGEDLENLAGVPIPIRVSGSFKEPKYALDFAAVAEAAAKSRAGKELEKKIDEKVGDDRVKGLLKGLIKQ